MGTSQNERRVCILYGSQSGTAQDVAERIWRFSKRRHWVGTCVSLDSYNITNLIYESIVVFVVSTTGQGDPPDNMKNFWRFIFRKNLPLDSLVQMQFGLLGLGDSSYARYNFIAKKLFKRLIQLGAQPLLDIGLADDQHPLGSEFGVNSWIKSWWEKMEEDYPNIQAPIPDSVCLPPKYRIQIVNNAEPGSHVLKSASESSSVPSAVNPFNARLLSNSRVTAEDHWQDVRLVCLDITNSHISYMPGDVAMVLPENSDEDVEDFLKLFNLTADTLVMLSPSSDEIDVPSLLPQPCSIYLLAKKYLDICGIPKRYFWELLAHFTDSDLEKEKLIEFCSPEGQDDLLAYCYRPHRTILEVLADFPYATAKIPLDYLTDLITPIQPRAFSIASAPLVHKDELQLIVAVVSYKTSLYKPRRGLCSSWLSNLCAGAQVPMWIRKGGFHFPSVEKPLILVGPGTGCAPFRSILWQRSADQQKNHCSESILFFGCRNRLKDFHFASEWTDLEHFSIVRVFTAFSRDQDTKNYVQDLMREQGALLWQLICKGAFFCVAGNARQMPQNVREALLSIVKDKGEKTETEAEQFIKNMELKMIYQTETWS